MSWNYVPPVANEFEVNSAAPARVLGAQTDQDEANTATTTNNESYGTPDLTPLDLTTNDGKVAHVERLLNRHDTYAAIQYALTVEGLDLESLEIVRELALEAFENLNPSLSNTEQTELTYALAARNLDDERKYSAPAPLALSA